IAKSKVIITEDSLYFYPIKVSSWSTANEPTALTSTVNHADEQVQLSWTGNEGTFRVFVWNENKLKTYLAEGNQLTIPMCEDGTKWAVFQSDEVSKTDVAFALSDLAFGDAIVIQNTATSVEDVPVSEAGVSVNGSQINITTEEAENIAIYDSLGHLLYQTKATYASFQAPSAGVYIVKVGAKKHKIWVK
ncbi:MAG: T9SS type A sorting domain-containing protein, partial [Paludibacteraceae bacterium]|nr:T9SS type A sorting domain-containing protein [Paludibacteraceae bacterium]